jgi:Flp pilus assembly protein TadG
MIMHKRRELCSEKSIRERCGAATVEFALCAPVFFFIVFSGIELSRTNMLIHTVESALLHGARRGIVPGASAAQCKQAAQEILDIARVRASTITVSPSVINDATTTISIAISVPLDNNGYQASTLFLGKSIERTAQLKRED